MNRPKLFAQFDNVTGTACQLAYITLQAYWTVSYAEMS